MKKLLFFAVALYTSFTVSAQYFQNVYGTVVDEQLNSGFNTVVQGQGYFVAGSNGGAAFGFPALSVSFADVTGGNPGVPYFDNEYLPITIGGVAVIGSDVQSYEDDNGNGFGLIGKYVDPGAPSPNTGIFYVQLDPQGNVTNAYDYRIDPSGGSDVIHVAAIAESASGKEIYITGWAQPTSPQVNTFVLKIDVATGAIIWGYVYDILNPTLSSKDLSHDIIESPYAAEVVVVGQTYDASIGSTSDGYFMRINSNTGTQLPVVLLYGTPSSEETFNAISVANNNQSGGPGFIVAGSSDANGTRDDYWLNLVDPKGSPFWSTLHDYSVNPGDDDRCNDVIERLNTSGKYEYYMGGTTTNGFFGGTDVLVIKTDENGKGVANGEFTYGAGNNDFGTRLDQYNNTGSDGLSVFGSFDQNVIGGTDMYLVRAYFDGQSGCNELIKTPNPNSGPSLFNRLKIKQVEKFVDQPMYCKQTTANNKQLCFAWTIPGASNARMMPTEPKEDVRNTISPNPIAQGASYAAIEVEANEPTDVTVGIYDMLGRTFYTHNFNLVKGKNSLTLDINQANMAAGMYSLRISGKNINQSIMLMVK